MLDYRSMSTGSACFGYSDPYHLVQSFAVYPSCQTKQLKKKTLRQFWTVFSEWNFFLRVYLQWQDGGKLRMELVLQRIHDAPRALSHCLETPWLTVFGGTMPQGKPERIRGMYIRKLVMMNTNPESCLSKLADSGLC